MNAQDFIKQTAVTWQWEGTSAAEKHFNEYVTSNNLTVAEASVMKQELRNEYTKHNPHFLAIKASYDFCLFCRNTEGFNAQEDWSKEKLLALLPKQTSWVGREQIETLFAVREYLK